MLFLRNMSTYDAKSGRVIELDPLTTDCEGRSRESYYKRTIYGWIAHEFPAIVPLVIENG